MAALMNVHSLSFFESAFSPTLCACSSRARQIQSGDIPISLPLLLSSQAKEEARLEVAHSTVAVS